MVNQFKRILAILGIIISGLMIILAGAGIIGTWSLKASLTIQAQKILTPITRGLEQADERIAQSQTNLITAQDKVGVVEDGIEILGQEVTDANLLLLALERTVGDELEPALNTLAQTVQGIRESVLAVQSTIEAINSIPFVSLPAPDFERLQKLSTSLTELQTAQRELRAGIQEQKASAVATSVDIVSRPLNRIDNGLNAMEQGIAAVNTGLNNITTQTAALQAQIPIWLTWLAIIVTIVLLWFIFSQILVLRFAYGYLKDSGPITQLDQS